MAFDANVVAVTTNWLRRNVRVEGRRGVQLRNRLGLLRRREAASRRFPQGRAARVRARARPHASRRQRPGRRRHHEQPHQRRRPPDVRRHRGRAGAVRRRGRQRRPGRRQCRGVVSAPRRIARLPQPARGQVPGRTASRADVHVGRHRRRRRVDVGIPAVPRVSVHAPAGRGPRRDADRRQHRARRLRRAPSRARCSSRRATRRSISGTSSKRSIATACGAAPHRQPWIAKATWCGPRSTCGTASTAAATPSPCRACSRRSTAAPPRRYAGDSVDSQQSAVNARSSAGLQACAQQILIRCSGRPKGLHCITLKSSSRPPPGDRPRPAASARETRRR